MKLIFKNILCLIFVSFQLTMNASNELVEQANALYKQNKFGEALQKYELLEKEGYRSADLHYNLGNCYFKNKQLGKAILHFERAAIQRSGDEDILHNLAFAKEQRIDDIEPLPNFFLATWWNTLAAFTSSTIWSILQYILLYSGAAGLIMWFLGKERSQRKKGFVVGIALMVLSLLPMALAYNRASFEQDSKKAIITTKKATLQAAPDEKSSVVLELHEGTDVALLDIIGDWHKVRLANGEVGWLPFKSVERI